MDPVQKAWMYNNWIEDQKDNVELAKNHAYLLGSFWNPEAVKQLMGDSNTYTATDEDFEESLNIVRNSRKESLSNNNTPNKRRRRKISQGNT